MCQKSEIFQFLKDGVQTLNVIIYSNDIYFQLQYLQVLLKRHVEVLTMFYVTLCAYTNIVLGMRKGTDSGENIVHNLTECQDGCINDLELNICDKDCVINHRNTLIQDMCFRRCVRNINDCLKNCTHMTSIRRMGKWSNTLGLPSF